MPAGRPFVPVSAVKLPTVRRPTAGDDHAWPLKRNLDGVERTHVSVRLGCKRLISLLPDGAQDFCGPTGSVLVVNCCAKEMECPIRSPCGYCPRHSSAFRIGALETLMAPAIGWLISTIRNNAVASARAPNNMMVMTVALRGASSPKLV